MTRILLLTLTVFIFTTCNKKVEERSCTDDNCYGTRFYTLTNLDKTYITTRDTIYKFVNVNNDTIKLVHRKTASRQLNQKFTCECVEKSTNISRESLYSVYIFENKNLAIQYSVWCSYPESYSVLELQPSNTILNIFVSDTNTVIYNEYKETVPCSQSCYTYRSKQNDMDSININNKYYYNVINTYDFVGQCPTMEIKDIYYSKGFGIVKFKYNNFVYDIIN